MTVLFEDCGFAFTMVIYHLNHIFVRWESWFYRIYMFPVIMKHMCIYWKHRSFIVIHHPIMTKQTWRLAYLMATLHVHVCRKSKTKNAWQWLGCQQAHPTYSRSSKIIIKSARHIYAVSRIYIIIMSQCVLLYETRTKMKLKQAQF